LAQKTRKGEVLLCISGNPPLIYPEISSIQHLTVKSPLIFTVVDFGPYFKKRLQNATTYFRGYMPFNKFLQLHRWKIYKKTLTIKLCHYKGALYERDPHPNKIISSE
jgi:hypothetical protein